jgi:hypothetical protein
MTRHGRRGTSLITACCLVISVTAFPAGVSAQAVAITIKDIEPNQFITGEVRGLSAGELSDHKVIVYVQTDKWYIHPVASQGEGKSWAALRPDGQWRLSTVQREHKANRVAALLVKKNYPEPPTADSLESIQRRAIVIRELQNTKDYGKL